MFVHIEVHSHRFEDEDKQYFVTPLYVGERTIRRISREKNTSINEQTPQV